jgi:hypothetical protein
LAVNCAPLIKHTVSFISNGGLVTKPNEVAWDQSSGIVVVNSQARVEQGLLAAPGLQQAKGGAR